MLLLAFVLLTSACSLFVSRSLELPPPETMTADLLNLTSTFLSSENMTNLYSNTSQITTSACVAFDLLPLLKEHRPVIADVSVYMPPIWWVIGIFGNIIALLVWLQPRMRHSSGYYLAALALSDLFFLVMNIIFEINFTHDKDILDKPALCQWFAISYLSLQYISPVLVLAFTVERYLSVCHPFRTVQLNRLSNSNVTILIIIGLGLGCILINAIQGYFWTTEKPDNPEPVCDLRADILAGLWTYWTWTTETIIFAAVPLTVLVLNILVIIEVSNISRLERRNMRTNHIDRRSTTLMLLGVSFYQIFTVLPVTTIYALYNSFTPSNFQCLPDDVGTNSEWQDFMQYYSVRLVIEKVGMSHYAANFFIYILTGKIFRKQLYEMVVFICCKDNLRYLATRTRYTSSNTRVTRLSLTSHRGSIAKGRLMPAKTNTDPCNNDTELGNKNSLYSTADLETVDGSASTSGLYHSPLKPSGAQTKLLSCVEELDPPDYSSDKESLEPDAADALNTS